MRSRRSRFEFACRVGAFAVLGWLLGTSVFPSLPRGVDRAADAVLESKLPDWTRTPSTIALHADLSAAPAPSVIDWLAALEHSGHSVTWSGSVPAAAMSAEALVDPEGGLRVSVSAPRGSTAALYDDVGIIDSVRIMGDGASAIVPVVVGRISARVGAQMLGVGVPDSSRLRAIAIIGDAGWEGKFVASALEERGWPVVARFAVAPNVDVTQSADALSLDTSRVAAVVVLDTALQSLGPTIDRFVRAGGGLVIAGPAATSSSLALLVPGSVGSRLRPAVEPTDTIGLGSTGFYPVFVRRDAVILDTRASGVAIAARRVGAGRVIQVGYDDSWRWRMAGGPGSERAHREWWSRVVGSVAYEPSSRTAPVDDASAPLVTLVDRVGPARAIVAARGRLAIDARLLMMLMMVFLLAEWASRRLRGYK